MSTPVLVATAVLGLGFGAAGAGIARAGSRRLAAAVALTGVLLLGAAAAAAAGRPDPGLRLWAAALVVPLPVAGLLFPGGAPPRSVGWTAVAVVAGTGAVAVADPDRYLWSGAAPLALAVLVLACVWWRYESAGERDRQALLWLAAGTGTVSLLGLLLVFLADSPGGRAALLTACLAVPAALWVGVRCPDVADVRALIVRAVVLVVAATAFVAVFTGGASAGVLLTGRAPSTGALAVTGALCAIGFGPLSALLRGTVDRMLFGDRAGPVAAASRVGEQLSDDPVPALRALRSALVLPYAALERDGTVVAASGTAPAATRRVPLRVGGRTAGELVVGLRPGAAGLDGADETALRIVAPALAQTLLARDLARRLQDSRAVTITAVEDERRRLRRDLHDGLGPTLTGVAFAADAAGNVLRADPERAAELVAGLRRDVADAIAEIRRLVEGLRPPAVDELGLVGALTQQATRMHAADGSPLRVGLDVPEPLPALPAAVEVAAYRIVVEALTNVARHAGCAEAVVALRRDGDGLRVEVRDGGAATGPWPPGVGLTSMRERAEQLGGTFRAGGGRVAVVLPL